MSKRAFEHFKETAKILFDTIDEFEKLQSKVEKFPFSVRRDLSHSRERMQWTTHLLKRALRKLKKGIA